VVALHMVTIQTVLYERYCTESTVFGMANRCDWVNRTIQHIRQSGLKGNWGLRLYWVFCH